MKNENKPNENNELKKAEFPLMGMPIVYAIVCMWGVMLGVIATVVIIWIF